MPNHKNDSHIELFTKSGEKSAGGGGGRDDMTKVQSLNLAFKSFHNNPQSNVVFAEADLRFGSLLSRYPT